MFWPVAHYNQATEVRFFRPIGGVGTTWDGADPYSGPGVRLEIWDNGPMVVFTPGDGGPEVVAYLTPSVYTGVASYFAPSLRLDVRIDRCLVWVKGILFMTVPGTFNVEGYRVFFLMAGDATMYSEYLIAKTLPPEPNSRRANVVVMRDTFTGDAGVNPVDRPMDTGQTWMFGSMSDTYDSDNLRQDGLGNVFNPLGWATLSDLMSVNKLPEGIAFAEIDINVSGLTSWSGVAIYVGGQRPGWTNNVGVLISDDIYAGVDWYISDNGIDDNSYGRLYATGVLPYELNYPGTWEFRPVDNVHPTGAFTVRVEFEACILRFYINGYKQAEFTIPAVYKYYSTSWMKAETDWSGRVGFGTYSPEETITGDSNGSLVPVAEFRAGLIVNMPSVPPPLFWTVLVDSKETL